MRVSEIVDLGKVTAYGLICAINNFADRHRVHVASVHIDTVVYRNSVTLTAVTLPAESAAQTLTSHDHKNDAGKHTADAA